MLDIGWTELLVIAIVLIVVVGPKDLPPMLRAFGKMTSNLRKMAGDFRTQFDEALREADMDDVRQTLSDAKSLNPANALRDAINPLRQMGQDIRNDLQKATAVPSVTETTTQPDDPLLTGDASETAQPSETAEPAAPAAPAAAAPASPAATATVPDTLTSAPEVPVVKRRAPRKPVDAGAPVDVTETTAAKPKRVAKTTPSAASKTTAPKTTAPAPVEKAEAAPKTPRKPRKPAAPKDDA